VKNDESNTKIEKNGENRIIKISNIEPVDENGIKSDDFFQIKADVVNGRLQQKNAMKTPFSTHIFHIIKVKEAFSTFGVVARVQVVKVEKEYSSFILVHFKDANSVANVMRNKDHIIVADCKFNVSEPKDKNRSKSNVRKPNNQKLQQQNIKLI